MAQQHLQDEANLIDPSLYSPELLERNPNSSTNGALTHSNGLSSPQPDVITFQSPNSHLAGPNGGFANWNLVYAHSPVPTDSNGNGQVTNGNPANAFSPIHFGASFVPNDHATSGQFANVGPAVLHTNLTMPNGDTAHGPVIYADAPVPYYTSPFPNGNIAEGAAQYSNLPVHPGGAPMHSGGMEHGAFVYAGPEVPNGNYATPSDGIADQAGPSIGPLFPNEHMAAPDGDTTIGTARNQGLPLPSGDSLMGPEGVAHDEAPANAVPPIPDGNLPMIRDGLANGQSATATSYFHDGHVTEPATSSSSKPSSGPNEHPRSLDSSTPSGDLPRLPLRLPLSADPAWNTPVVFCNQNLRVVRACQRSILQDRDYFFRGDAPDQPSESSVNSLVRLFTTCLRHLSALSPLDDTLLENFYRHFATTILEEIIEGNYGLLPLAENLPRFLYASAWSVDKYALYRALCDFLERHADIEFTDQDIAQATVPEDLIRSFISYFIATVNWVKLVIGARGLVCPGLTGTAADARTIFERIDVLHWFRTHIIRYFYVEHRDELNDPTVWPWRVAKFLENILDQKLQEVIIGEVDRNGQARDRNRQNRPEMVAWDLSTLFRTL